MSVTVPDARDFAIYYRVAAGRERQVDVAKAFEISQSQVSKIVAKMKIWIGIVKPDRGLSPGEQVYAAADVYREKLAYAERRATVAFDLTMKHAEAGNGRVKPCPRMHKQMVESIEKVFAAERICATLRAEAEVAELAKPFQPEARARDRSPEVTQRNSLEDGLPARPCTASSRAANGEGRAGSPSPMKGDNPEEYSEIVVAPIIDADSLAALSCASVDSYWAVVYANDVVNAFADAAIEEYGNIPEEEFPISGEEMAEYDGNITLLSTVRWWTIPAKEYASASAAPDEARCTGAAHGDDPEEYRDGQWHGEGRLQLAAAPAR